jgi:hypothetical protein
MSRLLSEASFAELMSAASRKMGRDEALVLVDISEDSPSSKDAYVIAGKDTLFLPRESIVAHGR